MAAKNCEINIPILDGSEYHNWKIRMFKFLQFKNCKDVVERAKRSTDDGKWIERDIQATNYIYCGITNKQLEYISELETAYEIIKKFDEMYLKKSTALQIVCRHNLESIKLKNFTEVTSFFDHFEKAVNELKQAGATITEQEKLNYMLKALPGSYSYLGDLIDILPENDRNVDYLKSKIKLKMSENESAAPVHDSSNAFRAEARPYQSKINCYGCGKPGHIKKDCRSANMTRGRGRGFSGYRGRGFTGYRGHVSNNIRNFNRGKVNYHQNNNESQGNNFHTTVANSTHLTKENDKQMKGQIEWLLDSGCTDHIINTEEYFDACETLEKPVKVKIGDGTILEATKVGNIETYFRVYGKKCEVMLTKVFYVKRMKANLLSYSKITDQHSIVSRGRLSKIYNKNGNVIAVAIKDERLYKMTSYMKVQDEKLQANVNMCNMTIKEKLHRTLGHINFNNLKIMCRNESLDGLPKRIENEYLKCATCIQNKMHNLPFQNNRRKAEEILEIVHTDVNGPHQTTGYNGEKYFLSFIDDYSKLTKVYCIKTKDEVCDYLIQYVNEVQNLTGKMIKELRCDNGKEYMNARVFRFAKEKGIVIKPCPAYVHELNGTAERYNRSLMDIARCLLYEAKVDRRFWPEVIMSAAYLKNRTLTNNIGFKTPYEIFFNRRPSVKNLKMYGSKVFVRVPEERRRSKWDKKADIGILLGYTDTGYRVLINNRVIIARHCDIIEEDVTLCGFDDEKENKIIEKEKEDLTTTNEEEKNMISMEKENTHEINNDEIREKEEGLIGRGKRQIKHPKRFDEEFVKIYEDNSGAIAIPNMETLLRILNILKFTTILYMSM
ncbi:unnamed protein product [Arctia plantaginis]|uniref:Retrovirus-related Pol polyprotein from transposon TNT 1-94 n=1 Tax=Arctia plantaginis TaxID=874455 RepID=A0A8S1ATD4_ARCPL|nr:unnamed protein product [Arctia plantaginis]